MLDCRAIDEAMAFVVAEAGGHRVVFAKAGEEAEAVAVAGSIREYFERASERGFVQCWRLPGQRLPGGVTPPEVLSHRGQAAEPGEGAERGEAWLAFRTCSGGHRRAPRRGRRRGRS
jgi:hypothetical protein